MQGWAGLQPSEPPQPSLGWIEYCVLACWPCSSVACGELWRPTPNSPLSSRCSSQSIFYCQVGVYLWKNFRNQLITFGKKASTFWLPSSSLPPFHLSHIISLKHLRDVGSSSVIWEKMCEPLAFSVRIPLPNVTSGEFLGCKMALFKRPSFSWPQCSKLWNIHFPICRPANKFEVMPVLPWITCFHSLTSLSRWVFYTVWKKAKPWRSMSPNHLCWKKPSWPPYTKSKQVRQLIMSSFKFSF